MATKPTLLERLTDALSLIRPLVPETPAHPWPLLAARTGAHVWVKHENHTPNGAFKIRGGINYMEKLRRDRPAGGVIAATRGNHGQSVAMAAARAGLSATVVVPRGNSVEKNAAMRAQGARLIEQGGDFQEALEFAQALAEDEKLHLVPSFHDWLIDGVATYSLELMERVADLDALYVPIGLGSGICGALAAREALGRRLDIIGVVAADAPAYALSFEAGAPVSTNTAITVADGMACRTPVPEAVERINRGVERVVRVGEHEIRAAMRHYFTDTHNVAEGAGAAPLAALLQERERMAGRKVGLVLSGGNVDKELFAGILAEAD